MPRATTENDLMVTAIWSQDGPKEAPTTKLRFLLPAKKLLEQFQAGDAGTEIDSSAWVDMGRPDIVTVTIEPGDKLNEQEDEVVHEEAPSSPEEGDAEGPQAQDA